MKIDYDRGAQVVWEGDGLCGVTLEVRARVEGVSEEELERLAQGANEMCPLSIALRNNVPVSVTVVLERAGD